MCMVFECLPTKWNVYNFWTLYCSVRKKSVSEGRKACLWAQMCVIKLVGIEGGKWQEGTSVIRKEWSRVSGQRGVSEGRKVHQ